MKLVRSFGFALNGLKVCFTSETNFKIHVLFTITAILLGIGLHISAAEWLVMLFCIGLVAGMEMMNTAVEKLCNVVQAGIHPGIKTVKDVAAGAVLVAAGCSLITGLVIFIPKIIVYLKLLSN
jgi:diacylglycerol kinase